VKCKTVFPAILFLLFHIVTHAQTPIKLEGCIRYKVPPPNAVGSSWELMGYTLEINVKYFDKNFEREIDGSIKVHSYTDVVVEGTFRYAYFYSEDRPHMPSEVFANFPAIKAVRKIEFFDKDGNKFFEDTFEQLPMYVPTITKTSDNSFTLSSVGSIVLSTDRARSWGRVDIGRINYETKSFSVSNEAIDSPDLVVVVTRNDPNPPYAPGVALWAPNPADYVFEFADDEEPPQTVQSAPSPTINSSSNNANTNKGFLSRIFGK